jgi:hypothetical protein
MPLSMENLGLPTTDRGVPLVMMNPQQSFPLQIQMSQSGPMVSHFSPQLLRPLLPGMPMMPADPAVTAAPVTASPSSINPAAAQLFYQQSLLHAPVPFPLHVQNPHVTAIPTSNLTTPSPSLGTPHSSPSTPVQAHIAQPDVAVAYGYAPSIHALLQPQPRKNNLRNGDVFLSPAGDLTADIDGVLNQPRPPSPVLSPPLSPTEFLNEDMSDVNIPLFDYGTRETVEYPVPASPPAESELLAAKKDT